MDTPFEIDFDSIKSQAADLLDKSDNAIPEADVPVVEAAPQAETPEVVAKDAPVVDQTTVEELDPDTHGERLVRVKVDGVSQVMKLKDVASGYSRTSHFTRQMQDLATQRKDFETRVSELEGLKAEQQNTRAFLANPSLVLKVLQESYPQLFEAANQPVQGDPNEIATVQQARDLVAAQAKQFQQTLELLEQKADQKIQRATQDLEARRETALFTEHINSTVKDIFDKNPILSKVRRAEDILRYEVAQMNPKTLKEANEAFITVAQGMVEDLQEGFTTANKTKVVAAAKLAKPRIEPPGGSGPQIQPRNFKKADGTPDWKQLSSAAADLMNG